VRGKRDNQRGATAVEYAVMASLVAGAVVLSVTVFGLQVAKLFEPMVAFFVSR
jgi:Flp pilus assembly pilin Flp